MFRLKIYYKNGLEAYRLVGSDGNDFFYEGKVEYSDAEVFKDPQGKAYYLVTGFTAANPGMKYYVEIEPEGTMIPTLKEELTRDKDIADLVVTSPREPVELPEDAFIQPEERIGAGPIEESVIEPISQGLETVPAGGPGDATSDGLMPGNDADSNTLQPDMVREEEKSHVVESASQAPATSGMVKKPGTGAPWPIIMMLAIAIVLVMLAGVYIYRPGLILGFSSAPTVTPTPVLPSPTPTSVPSGVPASGDVSMYDSMKHLAYAIDTNSSNISEFAYSHISADDDKLVQICDIYSHINGRWTFMDDNSTYPEPAGITVSTLSGDERDYSVVMCALTASIGVESRVIVSFNGNDLHYYPEVNVANNETGYNDAKEYLKSRYGISEPVCHSQNSEYWISLNMGTVPGQSVDSTSEYAVYPSGEIKKVK